jgi:inosine-uridine nucleoside N-ribohydrolase
MAVALEPDLARRERFDVEVVTGNGPCRGQTIVDRYGRTGREPNVSLVRKVPHGRFLAALERALAG